MVSRHCCSNVEELDQALDQVVVMVKQEQIYCSSSSSSNTKLNDSKSSQSPLSPITVAIDVNNVGNSNSLNDTDNKASIRREVCQWMYQVIDHYTFDRKIVSIGMHFFVRYTSLTTKKDYVKLELATATSLYLAMKLFGPKLSRNDNLLLNFVRMSNSRFNETQIVEMEMKMLNTFSWYVNPIVPQDFITYFVRILSHINPSLDKSAQTKLIELSIYVIELIVFTPQFMDDKPSSLACAAMAIALKQGVKATTSSIHYENDLDCLFPLFDYGFVNCSTIRDLSNQIISYLQQVSPIFDDIHFGNDPVHGMVYERVFPWEEKEKVHKCNNQAIATTCACSNMQHAEQ